MQKIMSVSIGMIMAISVMIGCYPHPVLAGGDGTRYQVTVTNLTRAQIFTPILVYTHKPGGALFALGEPSSEELAKLAEGGATAPLAEYLLSTGAVGEVTDSGGLLFPGESVSITVAGGEAYKQISLAAMLVPTNDGFIALNGAETPRGSKSVRHLSAVFDAGSEMNDESCDSIPAGDGCSGEGYSMEDGEGYVHIHAGIHGIGDIDAARYDWRNPAAMITIKRLAGSGDNSD